VRADNIRCNGQRKVIQGLLRELPKLFGLFVRYVGRKGPQSLHPNSDGFWVFAYGSRNPIYEPID
jgi:hypothetical protein